MTSRRALLLFVALTALHTWPLWTAPWRQSLNHNADVQYATWSLSWVAHTIATAPAHVFDGNIFAPEPTTLAYSEPVITPALAGAPLIWLGASPVLVYNVLLFAGLICSGWATWHLVRSWTGSAGAGLVAGALAAAGLAAGLADARLRRRTAVLALVGAAGVLLSLGPATAVYRWLYEWALPLQGLRAAARFGYLYLFAVAVLAGLGAAAIARRLPRRAAKTFIATALVLVSVEAWHGPVRTTPFDGVPRIYTLLVEHPDPVMLVEVPFFPPEAVHENGPYVLNASMHRQPVMNGHSGFTPMSYRRRAESFWFFPEDWAIEAIRQEGATHVMVHLELFLHEAPDVVQALLGRDDLWLVAADTRGHLLYEVR